MNEATETSRATKKTLATIASASIIKRVPREDPDRDHKERKLAGDYRVIHGIVLVPRPVEAFLNPDGTEKPFEAKTEKAIMGDIVRLPDGDAARLLDADIVEPLDAKPSRLGKVWQRPKIDKNFSTPTGGPVSMPPWR